MRKHGEDWVTIHLRPPLPTASSGLPGSLGRAVLWRSSIWPCTGWGLPSCRCRHRHWWALTSPFHPYPPSPRLWRAVCSLWHFPWGRPRSALPTILPFGARTFLSLDKLGTSRHSSRKRSPGPLYQGQF